MRIFESSISPVEDTGTPGTAVVLWPLSPAGRVGLSIGKTNSFPYPLNRWASEATSLKGTSHYKFFLFKWNNQGSCTG